jgi:hypothetical protein
MNHLRIRLLNLLLTEILGRPHSKVENTIGQQMNQKQWRALPAQQPQALVSDYGSYCLVVFSHDVERRG